MSKGVKAVIGIAAAVAVPFVAPAIATALGTSAVVSGAIAGAGLQAAAAAVTGGDVGRAALMGGIGGGIYGYASAPAAAAGPGISTAGAGTGGGAGSSLYSLGSGASGTGISLGSSGTGLTLPTAASGLSTAITPGVVDYSLASLAPTLTGTGAGLAIAPTAAFTPGAIDYSLATQPVFASGAGLTLTAPTFTSAPGGGIAVAPGATPTLGSPTSFINQPAPGPVFAPTVAAPPPPPAPTPTATTRVVPTPNINPATGQPYTFTEALKQVPGEIAAKFQDPKTLADLLLRAGGVIAGSAIAGDGLSDEERMLLNAQVEELRRLQQENQALFNQRLQQAQALIGESKYFDPEYFGLQRARRAQIAGARAKRAGLRGLTGGAREAEARRFDLATGRDVGTAFDQGYGTGVSGRLQTMQAGLSMMPQSYPSSMGDYTNIRQAYAAAEQRRGQQAKDIGALFGSLTGRP